MKIEVVKTYEVDLFVHKDFPQGFGSHGSLYVIGRCVNDKGKWLFINQDGTVEEATRSDFTHGLDYWIKIKELPWKKQPTQQRESD